ncbi:MAG: glycyl-radical enzyme activating protein [Thermodesulfobacteriota bacterium]|nr:glycyl-radical enzyme activating protein [Thermodesulfobacteriota bacterium]
MILENSNTKGIIFNIQGYSIHDGPGIRTTVFMKGCPLGCVWCANPESIKGYPQIFHNRQNCARCYRCIEICPQSAIGLNAKGGFPVIDRNICLNCIDRPCIAGCYESALELVGYYVTVDDLFYDICKDIPFYENSGGGVTFSGGEPTAQQLFTREVLKKCWQKGIHTALETCGYVPWETMKVMLTHLNLILFDVKTIDDTKHRQYTGVSNKLILENVEKIVSIGKVPIIMRVPIVPGFNDSPGDIEDLIYFAKEIGINEVNLLPYHGMGASKYDKLGMNYRLKHVPMPSKESMEDIKACIERKSLICTIQ